MTAEPQESSSDTAAWAIADRNHLLAALNDAPRPFPDRAYQVVRQYSHLPEHQVCAHRWGWVAELCARRRMSSRRHAAEIGVFYTARSYAERKDAERWRKRLAAPERLEIEQ